MSHPDLLIGSDTKDDAAVYKISDDTALIFTVDFFPPIVDDPYTFGEIAASNALSDIYAMGGKPILALNIVGFPIDLPKEILTSILKGGANKIQEAGAIISGGHTVDDAEPKYGLAILGIVKPGEQISNANAKDGDLLVLTKPLGTGIITTAAKQSALDDLETLNLATSHMKALNQNASLSMVSAGANACTDITGFGLLGHLKSMMEASNKTATIEVNKIPVIQGVWDLIKKKILPGGTFRNLDSISSTVDWDTHVTENEKLLLSDAQTSGGLLISISEKNLPLLLEEMKKRDCPDPIVIGKVSNKENNNSPLIIVHS